MTCDHTTCHAYEAVTGISGCLCAWDDDSRGGARDPLSCLPSTHLTPPDSSCPSESAPALGTPSASLESSSASAFPGAVGLGGAGSYDPRDPDAIHARQGRTVEHWERNERVAQYVAGAGLFLVILIALAVVLT